MTISTITHTNNHEYIFKQKILSSHNYGVKVKDETKLFAGIPVITGGIWFYFPMKFVHYAVFQI